MATNSRSNGLHSPPAFMATRIDDDSEIDEAVCREPRQDPRERREIRRKYRVIQEEIDGKTLTNLCYA